MLTREQLKANIEAFEKQGAKPEEIQEWLNSLSIKKDNKKSEDIKIPERDNFYQPFAPPQAIEGIEKFGGLLQKAGETFISPTLRTLETGIMQPIRKAQEIIPGGKAGREVIDTPFGKIKNIKDLSLAQRAAGVADVITAGLPVEQLAKKPLTLAAEKLYQSGAKFRNIIKGGKVIVSAKELVKTGLKEKIWLTRGGVERVANRIDEFEELLGEAIDKAKNKGGIAVNEVVKYVDDAKDFFSNQANRVEAKNAIKYLDNLKKEFRKDFGAFMPIEKAQKVKVATGQSLRKYYNSMSSAAIEGEKQLVRGLKEKIVEKAPQAGDINARLASLYKFDAALQKANNRIRNLNLLGLGAKVGTVLSGMGGAKEAALGFLVDMVDNPAIKSGVAINLNRLAGLSEKVGKTVKIPLVNLIHTIIDDLSEE